MSEFQYPVTAPNKEQDGFVYARLKRLGTINGKPTLTRIRLVNGNVIELGYSDTKPDQRIISSRRVEEAVETADYLRLCQERFWRVVFLSSGIVEVWKVTVKLSREMNLRRAYLKAVEAVGS